MEDRVWHSIQQLKHGCCSIDLNSIALSVYVKEARIYNKQVSSYFSVAVGLVFGNKVDTSENCIVMQTPPNRCHGEIIEEMKLQTETDRQSQP